MKPIDNYINERLNPKNLRPKFNIPDPVSIQETLAWEFKFNNRKYVINTWGWQYVIIKGRTENIYLVFWSPESSYIFLTDSKDHVFSVMIMKKKACSSPEFYQDLIRHISVATPQQLVNTFITPEQLEIDDAVGDIVDDFYQKYK